MDDQIRNDSITVSSQKSAIDGPENSRLGSSRRSWVPQTSDKNQWLQVDLGNKMQITGIATRGHHNSSCWVKRYSLQYSNNGVLFEVYAPEKQPKVNSNKIILYITLVFLLCDSCILSDNGAQRTAQRANDARKCVEEGRRDDRQERTKKRSCTSFHSSLTRQTDVLSDLFS